MANVATAVTEFQNCIQSGVPTGRNNEGKLMHNVTHNLMHTKTGDWYHSQTTLWQEPLYLEIQLR